MPMEVCLILVPVVSANGVYPEGESGNDVIDESDGMPLGMPIIDS